jgi:hypothetical protein
MSTQIRTTHKPRTLIEMFLDGTPNEIYENGRLYTREGEEGRIELVAYGNEVIASIDPAGNDVEMYIGHYKQVSETVTGYIETLGSVLSRTSGREVSVLRDAAPTLGYGARASAAAQYINSYVNFARDFSAVEKDAVSEVNDALVERLEADPAVSL